MLVRRNLTLEDELLPAAVITKEYHLLPGRLRISVDGLRHSPSMARHVEERLARLAGVRSVRANHLTGRVLVHFDSGKTGLSTIQGRLDGYRREFATQHQQCPASQQAAASALSVRTAAVYAAATGGVLAGMVAKRLLGGRSPLAASPQVFNAAAAVTLVSGYPILRRSFNELTEKRRVNADLLLLAATLVLLAMRESITGLSVLWIVHLNNLFRAIVQDRSRREIAAIMAAKEAAERPGGEFQPASNFAGQAPLNGSSGDFTASKVVQWSAGTVALSFLLRRDFSRSLAVLLAACPEAVELARHSALGAATAKAVGQGIYVRDTAALTRASVVDTVVFAGGGCRERLRREEKIPASALADLGVSSLDLTGKPATALPGGISWQDLPPAGRVRLIEGLRQAGRRVMLVAGGDDDGPALAAADVGVALGGRCSGPAGESAAVIIGGSDLAKVAALIALSRQTGRIAGQNRVFSTSLGAAGVALAVARLLSPVGATLLLNLSTVGIIANSLRLMRNRPPPAAPALDLQRFAGGRGWAGEEPAAALLPTARDWSTLLLPMVCDGLGTSDRLGISPPEAAQRLTRLGANVLAASAKPTFWQLFKEQFKDFMVRILLGAAALSFVLGRAKDAFLTLAIVAANAILGILQERKAEQAIEALQRIAAPTATVVRAGRTAKVMAADLVPGDIILLEAGDRIPADARLLTATHFEVEESSLTGETVPVKKNSGLVCTAGTALADRRNMVFMGTAVTRGRATAVIVATGMATEMGKIATMIQAEDGGVTPLQRRLEELAKFMVYVCLGIAGLILAVGVWRGLGLVSMLQTAASLAVAAIPEGLTAIVIIALAMGVQRMSKRNIIVRKLSALETLGCATVICSDKTGTLTKNEMTVRAVYTHNRLWQVSGEGYTPRGTFSTGGERVEPAADPALFTTLLAGALCNNARLVRKAGGKVVPLDGERDGGYRIDGDPTEGALLVAAAKAGLGTGELAGRYRRVAEIPFDSERRMMSVIVAQSGGMNLYCKGAPDAVLAVCRHYLRNGEVLPLDDEVRRRVREAGDTMAGNALRVLACAFRPVRSATDPAADSETDMIFTGLVGMIDPPRPEVPAALVKCRQAGVKVIMVTGDHPKTARAVAAEIGLKVGRDGLLEGWQVEEMNDAALLEVVERVAVYARTSPQHKLRIIKALKCRGYIVAMTGDGVNDAPAVKAADIGIAMGLAGTDVTKEAASMTLGDDNFATIVRAVEEGRSIYVNIRKAIRYLIATNLGEVILMLMAVVAGLPLPLLPIQLLWINLVGDGLPAVALVNDPPAGNIMNQPPRTADDSVFAGGLGVKVLSRGLTIGLTSLGVYAAKLASGATLATARTLVMTELAISQFIHIFDCRLEIRTGRVGAFSNLWLVGAVALSMLMVAGVVHLPGLHAMFGTASLTAADWTLAIAAAMLTSLADLSLGRFLARKIAPRYPRLAVLN